MTVKIYERQGDTMEIVGSFDPEEGEWIQGGDRLGFEHDEHYDAEMMVERFDGPYLFGYNESGEEVDKAGSSIGEPIAGTLADYETVTVDTEDEEEGEDVEPSEKADLPDVCRDCEENIRMEGNFRCPECHPDTDAEDFDGDLVAEKSHADVGEKVYVDSPRDAPNDKIVHVDVDDEGDPQEAYYHESEG